MRTGSTLLFFAGAIVFAVVVGVQLFDWPVFGFAYGNIVHQMQSDESVTDVRPIGFTGDVMLAREVEQYMLRYGTDYPFQHLDDQPEYEYLFINFEAAVPKKHQPTPAEDLTFSVLHSHVVALSQAGVTHASLANNHSYDFGGAGYLSTRDALDDSDVVAFGHPKELTADTTTYLWYEGDTIAVIGLNPLEHALNETAVSELVSEVARESDLQLAYVHWGIEYDGTANSAQRKLAQMLIEAGVDAVIGHHPHVVQNIEMYQNAPIFYSLGNFVFDQYFSSDVMQGLLLQLSRKGERYEFELLPLSSEGSRTQPRLQTGYERERFLRTLAEKSDPALRDSIRAGKISLDGMLAY